jgi:hopanoid biosynthesis associated protein HpnK
MVAAPAAAEAVALAKSLPGLKIGLHLVLVEGRPVLPPELIPDLVGADGLFRPNMALAGASIFFRPKVRRQLAAEIEAQLKAFRATGLALDHVNAHKHFHLHPTIAGLTMRIGASYGAKAVRVPLEPAPILRATGDRVSRPLATLAQPWAVMLGRRLRSAGMATPDQVFGLAWSGAMTAGRLAALLRHLPAGLSEIYLHPATAGGFPGAAPGYRYAEELAALTDAAVIAAADATGAKRGGFADFAAGAA